MRNHRRMGAATAAIATAAAVIGMVVVALAPGGATNAAFSDFGNINGNSASAAVWEPNPNGLDACGDLSSYESISYVNDSGTEVHAMDDGVLVVNATDTLVFARPHTCIIATVTGVDVVNLDGTVHLVLKTLSDVCQTANQPPKKNADTCADWADNHPALVTVP